MAKGKGSKAAPTEDESSPSSAPLTKGDFNRLVRLVQAPQLATLIPAAVRANAGPGAAAQADLAEAFHEHVSAVKGIVESDLDADEKLTAVQAELEKGELTTAATAGPSVGRWLVVDLHAHA